MCAVEDRGSEGEPHFAQPVTSGRSHPLCEPQFVCRAVGVTGKDAAVCLSPRILSPDTVLTHSVHMVAPGGRKSSGSCFPDNDTEVQRGKVISPDGHSGGGI